MKTWLCSLFALLITISMVANKRALASDDTASVSTGANQFAIDLYSKLRDNKGNLFFSPYSISTALAMTYAGARSGTADEMAKVLNFTLPQEKLHPAYAALVAKVTPADAKGYQLSVANALWGKQGFQFDNDFLKTLQTNYGAGLTPINVDDGAAATKQINQWVEDKTNQKIKDLVPRSAINAMTRLVLTNAIYFKGNWSWQFKKELTREGKFSIAADNQVPATMMNQKGNFRFFSDEQLKAIEMPYAGADLSMLILLPQKVDGLGALEKQLSTEKLAAWTAAMSPEDVVVALPKFKLTSQFDLGETLAGMGMPQAFSPTQADFSGMVGRKTDLYISKVIHKAFVDVNEEGTEAAAATAVIVKARGISRNQEFVADHPFLFAIKHNATNTILFLGRVTDPRE